MKSTYRYIFCTVLSTLVSSQELDITTLTNLVVEGNPDLIAVAKQIDISEGHLNQSKRLPNPVIEFESGTGTDPETIGMVSQTIPISGKRKLQIELRNLELKKAKLEYEILKQAKLTEAFNKFVTILHLQENKNLQLAKITVAEELLSAVNKKVEAGKLSVAEKSRARIKLIQERLKLHTIENSLKNAWKSISSLWRNGKPSFNLAIGRLSQMGNFPALISLDNAPDIQFSKLSLEIQKTKVQSEKANAIPDFELGAGLKQSDIPGNTFQVGLSVPLPIFNRNRGNIQSAVSELEQAQLKLLAVESRLNTAVSNLQSELKLLTSEAAILNDDIIPEAQTAYTIITEGYLNGRFTYLDIVDAQEMWFQSREQYLDALKGYHQKLLKLDQLTGNKTHSQFMENN